ncbi:peptidoglycan DD-metalloendopeptidase family protein [Funiculus sociatus GB2-A5]|uniref:Peptidoglycan DD-metalloendopeptidase family protein n=2 Tax=Cyanobacteriota TaxID=1117 RepID=A0ABV0JIZ2_9CYAN|nr:MULTISPECIES: peptidoglycan DD-metalloendopeptidase family protein [unclassified Trichocoleus]MBD1907349.1 peptidoglycan DD-metalloendopeptidase family protein [Trichocoleus sp. FACHB-832]MBD2062533.1 peptidoglycan DD-metalloendopeptidase family protein [Trichocoleus sp. FACHB-6]
MIKALFPNQSQNYYLLLSVCLTRRFGKTKLHRNSGRFLSFVGGIALCFSLWLMLSMPVKAESPTPPPVTVDTLKQMQQQLDRQRSNFSQESDRLQKLEKAAQGQLGKVQQNINLTDTQINDYQYQLQQATQTLKKLQNQLFFAQRDYQQKQAATVARLRFLQRQNLTNQGWNILLSSQNFNQFFDRRRQIKLVFQADRQILSNLKAQSDQINSQKIAVEQQENQIALISQQLLLQKADFMAQGQVQQQLIERLNSNRQALEAAERVLAEDSQGIATLIQKRVAEAKAKEAAEKAILRGDDIKRSTGGIFGYPSDAAISSNFGWRIHPILGYRRLHSGLDFAASYGSTIRAAESGEVIFAGWYGGYGKAVIVNHGKGITTLYAHSSQLYVSEGQLVRRGDAIASVGSTGFSTGPHLHFEVRKNGEPVDPINYL